MADSGWGRVARRPGRVRAVEDDLQPAPAVVADGTWERLLGELRRGCDAGLQSWDVGVDSTVIRAHQHAAGAPHTPPGDVSCERLAVALEDFESTRARSRPGRTGG